MAGEREEWGLDFESEQGTFSDDERQLLSELAELSTTEGASGAVAEALIRVLLRLDTLEEMITEMQVAMEIPQEDA